MKLLKLSDFKKEIPLPTLDSKLSKKIEKYKSGLFLKNAVNSDFATSLYIGIHHIRFTDADNANLFLILDVFEEDVVSVIKKLEYIDVKWKVASNPFMFLCSVMIEHIHNSSISKKLKHKMIVDLAIVMQFKRITSLYSHYFKHIEKLDIVKAAYEQLSNKSMHKQYGSNYNVLLYRAELLLNNKTHIKHLNKSSVQSVVYIITDMSNSIASVLKHWYKHLYRIKEEGYSITNTSIVTRGDEGERIDNVEDAHSKYLNNVELKVVNKYEWINKDKIDLILEIVPRLNRDKVVTVLTEIHLMYLKNPKEVQLLLKNVMEVCIRYLYVNKTLYPPYVSRTGQVMKYLKNLYSSSSRDKQMRKSKLELSRISAQALGTKSKQLNLGISIVISVYIFILSIDDNK